MRDSRKNGSRAGVRGAGMAAMLAVALGGCANTGLMESKGLSESFPVEADYQAAFRRAGEYVRVCHEARAHRYDVTYGSLRELGVRDAPNRLKVYRTDQPVKILEIISVAMDGPNKSNVTVNVLGEGPWDAAEIAAAGKSIQTATPVCRPE